MNPKTEKTQDPTSQTFDAWKKMVDEQLGRIESLYGEAARYEKQAVGQANTAIDELGTLMKDSLEYACQLSGEWRKVALDATQRASEMFRSAASR